MNLVDPHAHGLRVPVERAQVEVQTDRERRTGVVFLAPDSSPDDVFEEDSPFVPVEIGGKTRLYARAAVVSVVVDAVDGPPESLVRLGVPMHPRAVAVHLRNGTVLTGVVMLVGREERTLDLLNRAHRSIAVHAGGQVHHVAKAHVEHVEELS